MGVLPGRRDGPYISPFGSLCFEKQALTKNHDRAMVRRTGRPLPGYSVCSLFRICLLIPLPRGRGGWKTGWACLRAFGLRAIWRMLLGRKAGTTAPTGMLFNQQRKKDHDETDPDIDMAPVPAGRPPRAWRRTPQSSSRATWTWWSRRRAERTSISLLFGLTIGFGTGFAGTGGGMIILVVFTAFLGMELKTAI